MKLLLFYAHEFWYKTARKTLAEMPDIDREERTQGAVVVFFHVEAEDQEKGGKPIQKFVKNVKWLCGKFGTRQVVLHSFNHLSSSKAPPDFSKAVLDEVCARLERTDTWCTPRRSAISTSGRSTWPAIRWPRCSRNFEKPIWYNSVGLSILRDLSKPR